MYKFGAKLQQKLKWAAYFQCPTINIFQLFRVTVDLDQEGASNSTRIRMEQLLVLAQIQPNPRSTHIMLKMGLIVQEVVTRQQPTRFIGAFNTTTISSCCCYCCCQELQGNYDSAVPCYVSITNDHNYDVYCNNNHSFSTSVSFSPSTTPLKQLNVPIYSTQFKSITLTYTRPGVRNELILRTGWLLYLFVRGSLWKWKITSESGQLCRDSL